MVGIIPSILLHVLPIYLSCKMHDMVGHIGLYVPSLFSRYTWLKTHLFAT